MDKKQASLLTMAGGALLIIGSFLAWAKISGEAAEMAAEFGEKTSQSGISGGDGWFTVIAGALLLAAGWMAYSGKAFPMWVGLVGLVIGVAMTVFEYFDITSDSKEINDLFDSVGVDGSAGVAIGIWVLVLGCVAALAGFFMGRSKKAAA